MVAVWEQTSFRLRNDDGNEADATWKQAINVNDTINVDENFRPRFGITVSDTNQSIGCQLEYNLAGAGWNAVNATSSVVQSSASPNVANGATITEQLDQSKTFTARFSPNGGFDEVDGLIANQSLTTTEEMECEYCVQIQSGDVTDGQTIELRISRAGTALDTYTNTPTVTVSEAGVVPVINLVMAPYTPT